MWEPEWYVHFSREKDETEQFNEISGSLKDTQLYAGKISALMNPSPMSW